MRRNPDFSNPQQGAILVVSLLLLLVMTVLALTASQTTRLQERMAGNARDVELAFQAGEVGLRAGELLISDFGTTPPYLCDDKSQCLARDRKDTEALQPEKRDLSWWMSGAFALGKALYAVSEEPHYYIERRADIKDTLTRGDSRPPSGTAYYRTTTRAQGASTTAITVTETTYAVRY